MDASAPVTIDTVLAPSFGVDPRRVPENLVAAPASLRGITDSRVAVGHSVEVHVPDVGPGTGYRVRDEPEAWEHATEPRRLSVATIRLVVALRG